MEFLPNRMVLKNFILIGFVNKNCVAFVGLPINIVRAELADIAPATTPLVT